MVNNESRSDAAKARAEAELSALNVKIDKLNTFLYGDGDKLAKANLSHSMIVLMQDQLDTMLRYADILQERILIWV